MERLDKLLAATGRWSRREVKQLVRQGQVLVNGVPAASAEEKYDPASAAFTVCGQPLTLRRYTYVLLHKPAGVLTATEDRRQPPVLELLPPELRRIDLAPVGRLDKDTEGLLLFTNDGDLLHRLISPKKEVPKVYYARHEGTADAEDAAAFAEGLTLRDGTVCLPALLKPLGPGESLITVREGKYHQVRRMMASRGMTVLYLERRGEGSLVLGDLPRGMTRELTAEEIKSLEDLTTNSAQ